MIKIPAGCSLLVVLFYLMMSGVLYAQEPALETTTPVLENPPEATLALPPSLEAEVTPKTEAAPEVETTPVPAPAVTAEGSPGTDAPPPPTPGGEMPPPPGEEAPAISGAAPPEQEEGGIMGLFRRFDLFQGLQITGNASVTMQQNSVEGSEESYLSQRWDSDSIVRQAGLHLEGPIWKQLLFQADVSDSGWGQSYRRWIVGWVGKDTALIYGDIDLQIAGNEFVGFRKSTQGWQLDQILPNNGFARAFYTREKGLTRRQTITGNDTSGPYFLTYTPMIEGSEVIKVNETYVKIGVDYRLDYDTGQLWFEPVGGVARIISASDTISASYQSLNYSGSGPSDIYGARAEMPFFDDKMLVGVTMIQQSGTSDSTPSDTVSFQEDVYNGSGSTGPFDTSFRPVIPDGTSAVYKGENKIIDQALIVLLDGAEQVEGVDYYANRSIGRVEFRRMVPPTALVRIQYYYDLGTKNIVGDQRVWGVDMSYRPMENLGLSLDYGLSQDEAGNGGSALAAYADYSLSRMRLSAEYRNVDPDYNFIDSVGFQNREKGYNLGLEWDVTDDISISDRFSDMQTDSGLSFGYSGFDSSAYSYAAITGIPVNTATSTAVRTAASSLNISSQRNDFNIRYSRPGLPTISYQRGDMSNTSVSSGTSNYSNDTLSANWTSSDSKINIRNSYSRTSQESVGADTVTGSPDTSGSRTAQWQSAVTWNPSTRLSFSVSFTNNESEALESENSSSATNLILNGRYEIDDKTSLSINRSDSRTDGRVSSNLYGTTSSIGTSGANWTGTPLYWQNSGAGTLNTLLWLAQADDDEVTVTRPSSTDYTDRVNLSWRPRDDLNFDLGVGRRVYSSQGGQGYLSDSEQIFASLSAMWMASPALSFNASLGMDKMDFTGENQGTVENNSVILGASYRPLKAKWGASVTLNIQDGSSPTYIGEGRLQRYVTVPTKLFDLGGQLQYTLRDDLTLSASTSLADFSGGYADFQKNTSELRLRYQLTNDMAIDGGYRFIRNISRVTDEGLIYGTSGTGDSYLTNTFLLSFSANFRGGISKTSSALGQGYGSGSGGPGTFGGYQSGIYQESSSNDFLGGSTGSNYLNSGFNSNSSYSTGIGKSRFDTIGSGNGYSSGYSSSGSGILTRGLGDFGQTRRSGSDSFSGRDTSRKRDEEPRAGAAKNNSDWLLLNDNRSSW